MKKFRIFLIITILVLTGCTSDAEWKAQEKEAEASMIAYLKKNYKINDVTDIELESDNLFGLTYTGHFGGIFKVNNKKYYIICSTENECYDSYTYEIKIKPLLKNIINKSNDNTNLEINNIETIDYSIDPGPYNRHDFNGLFNANIIIKSEEDLINYYNNKIIDIIITYINSEKLLIDKLIDYENLYESLTEELNLEKLYLNINININKDEYLEQLKISKNSTESNYKLNYYGYDNTFIGNYNIFWISKIITDMNTKLQNEINYNYSFKLIDNNDNYFPKKITIKNEEKYLYNSQILQINKEANSIDDIFIGYNGTICNQKKSYLVYKKDNEYKYETKRTNFFLYNDYNLYDNEFEKLAIYCEK